MSRRLPLIATAALLSLTLAADAARPIRPPKPLTPAELDQLTAPIALYPDPLLAQILTASTHPLDVALATQWLTTTPTPTDDLIAAQPWDPSVQTLVHYPAAFHLLADNLAWTQSLGLAYTNQPNDVTKSIQRLRAKARAIGTLTNSPEQTIIVENHYIQIQPAEPEIIYVPIYDPNTCYTRRRPPHFERPQSPPPPTTPSTPSAPPPAPTARTVAPSSPAPEPTIIDIGNGNRRVEVAPQPVTPAPAAPVATPAPPPQPAAAPLAPTEAPTAARAHEAPRDDSPPPVSPPTDRSRGVAQ